MVNLAVEFKKIAADTIDRMKKEKKGKSRGYCFIFGSRIKLGNKFGNLE